MNAWEFLDKNLWALVSAAIIVLWSVERIADTWLRRGHKGNEGGGR
jgi:hypothetical protein